jgi:hypothetical protein
MSETDEVVAGCRVRASQMGLAMWRNNSGAAFDRTGRMVRYGLGNDSAKLCRVWKSGDLIGVGFNGVFVGAECKRPGWTWRGTPDEVAQHNFMENVRRLGGRAGFVTSADEYEALVLGWTNGGKL